MPVFDNEVLRRRTFAIISHPDAGKTTMTEKLLLHGGMIHLAGEVHGKKNRKTTVSDWMSIEQERGISVSTSVMQFDYKNLRVNLLDTPGHADFSEDTYRTLTAVDNALMVIDNAKGVESQTKKLYEVCKLRNIPLYTFINKMDREGRDPFELLDEVEKLLNVSWYPVTWPIGMGKDFKGVYDRARKKVYLYHSSEVKGAAAELNVKSATDPELKKIIGDDELYQKFIYEMELLDQMMPELDQESFLNGKVTAVLFGSAKYDFGVDRFLDCFGDTSTSPLARNTSEGNVNPLDENFSAFVFKIQANVDKNHRDRVAYLRICSGKFERGMMVKHARLETQVRLMYSQQFFANKRETVEDAYAGDILGVHDSGNLQIGDTLYTGGKRIVFEKIPQFPPEIFSKVQLLDPLKKKQLKKGIQQLCEEGTIQMFVDENIGEQDPVLAAVGALQFEVFVHRLKEEYGVDVRLIAQNYTYARWLEWKGNKTEPKGTYFLVRDLYQRPVVLFEREWDMRWAIDNNPDIIFHEIAPLI